MKAEHRLGLRASEIPAFAAELAKAVGVAGVNAPAYAWTDAQQKFLAALAKDLKANAGKCAVIPGLYQDESVAQLALAINSALGNVGKTVTVAPAPMNPLPSDQLADFKSLVADLNAGKVDWLVILNGNPIYTAPADLKFADAFEQGQHRRAPGLACRRDGADLALAYSGRALSGVVVGCSRLRRHGFDYSADDRSALWRQDGAHVIQSLLDEPMLSPYEAVRETWKPVDQGRL